MACRKCESIDYHSDDDGTWDYEENPTYHLMKHCSTCQSREALKERKEQQEYENAMENEVALARMKITNVLDKLKEKGLSSQQVQKLILKNIAGKIKINKRKKKSKNKKKPKKRNRITKRY